jgi:hypothetical protein
MDDATMHRTEAQYFFANSLITERWKLISDGVHTWRRLRQTPAASAQRY